MREFDRAVGRLLACASSLEMHFESEWADRKQYIRLRHGGNVATAIAAQDRSQFTLVSEQRLSHIDGREITESKPFEELEKTLYREPSLPNIGSHAFTEEIDGISYVDGFRYTTPLFVYSDDFDARELDRTVTQLVNISRKNFVQALEGLDLTQSDVSSAGEGDKSPSEVSDRNGL